MRKIMSVVWALMLLSLIFASSHIISTASLEDNSVCSKKFGESSGAVAMESSSSVDWWPMYQHDPRHTSYSTSTAPNTNDTLWTFETDEQSVGPGPVVDGRAFSYLPSGKVRALNATDGTLLWTYAMGDNVNFPAVSDGVVFVPCNDNKLYALNESTGTFIWSYTLGGDTQQPTVADGMVFTGEYPAEKLYALNKTNGNLIWSYDGALFGPAVADGMVFSSSLATGRVYAFDEFTGAVKWTYAMGSGAVDTPSVAYGMVFIGAYNGLIYALNETTGNPIWTSSVGSMGVGPGCVAIAYGRVFFPLENANNQIYALNATTGAFLWSYQTGGTTHGPLTVADGKVFIVSYDAKVHAVNATTGSLIWSYNTGIPSPVAGGSYVVVNGILYTGSGNYWNPSGPRAKLFAFGPLPSGYYKLTITATTGGTTSPAGTKIYPRGTDVSVTAIPYTGYVFDHWELDGKNVGSTNPIIVTMNKNHALKAFFVESPVTYDVTIDAYCYTEAKAVSVGITMDGSPTGYTTPHTFTGLIGTHTFTVPSNDPNGHPFKQWSTGSTSTTITVSAGGTYTAHYGSRPSGVGGVDVAIDPLGLLAPYIGLASTILIATVATNIYYKRIKRRKEKQ